MSSTSPPSRLARRLGLGDAVLLGLGSMVGAGIFAAAGPAAEAAGSGLLFGVLLAGGVAYLNAATMAQLASVYPESGGTYVYARKILGPAWGFLAGWGFVIGKLASCTAMALTFAYYAYPENPKAVAAGTVLALTFINLLGVRKTALATKILVGLVFVCLAAVAFASLAGGGADVARLSGWTERGGLLGIMQAAGLMFFAFAGYARVATLGEEVVNPKRNIPRAIVWALGIALAAYAVITSAAVLTVDTDLLARSKTPLALAVESGKYAALVPVVRIGACLASLGVLLSLMAGISRTIFAMAANGDLPPFLAAVHPRRKVPHRAEIAVGLVIASVVSIADLRSAIGFSSFAILLYYAVANLAALKLSPVQRLWPKWMALAGLLACVTIALTLPALSISGGLILFVVGLAVYKLQSGPRRYS